MKKSPLHIFNFSIHNVSADKGEIYIDGDIVDAPTQEMYKAYWGDETSVSYKSFRDQILNSGIKNFDVYVNTTGGHVGDAMAMHDLIQDLNNNKGYNIDTIGRGIVASAGTYILMAGKNTSASKNTSIMIHNVQVGLFGYYDVDVLQTITNSSLHFNQKVTDFYTNVTGLSNTVIKNMMSVETWMSADEAKAKNFIKSVTGDATFTNQLNKELFPFQNTSILNHYNSFIQNSTTMDMTKVTNAIQEGFKNLLAELGLSNKATEEKVNTALTAFSDKIANSIKENIPAAGTGLTTEDATTLVNKLLEEKTKDDVTTIQNAVKEGMKGLVNQTELEEKLKAFQNSVIKALGEGSTGGEGGKPANQGGLKTKNRFAGVDWFPASKS